MQTVLLTAAGFLLLLWLVSGALHLLCHLFGWLISTAPYVASALIILSLFVRRKTMI